MFLLVPAHPGCPRQIPHSRKMVVCLCVLLRRCKQLGTLSVFSLKKNVLAIFSESRKLEDFVGFGNVG